MMRSPVSLTRLRFAQGAKEVVYTRKGGHHASESGEDERAALRRRCANLIRRVYEVDPLVCPRCGSEMQVIGFITKAPTYCQ